MISVPPPTRIALGTINVGGQSLELFASIEWARYFESLNTQVNTITLTGAAGAAGAAGATGAAMALSGDGGDGAEFIPGPPGTIGQQGTQGLPLFMLQDVADEPMMQLFSDMAKASLSGAGFTGLVAAPGFSTNSASLSAATGVATTIITLANQSPRMWLVSANIGTTNDTANYNAFAVVSSDGTAARIALSNNGASQTITLSGLNIQSTQSSGGTQTINMTITGIG